MIESLTEETLASDTEPSTGRATRRRTATRSRSACGTVLNEEWEHRRYAERDLDVLEGSSCSSSKSATPRFQ